MAGAVEGDARAVGTTAHHAKYFAWELTRRRAASEEDRLAQSLFDASVDLNPHQIDAALFAINNPLSKGAVLADEVGLGKTIEAALVLCRLWAERRRRLLVICPASLRKQWAQELADKFNLPTEVLDARTWHLLREGGTCDPLDRDVISIMSIHFAARTRLQRLLDKQTIDEEWIQQLIEDEDLDEDLLEEAEPATQAADGSPAVDYALVREELAELDEYLRLARNIREDQKSHTLLAALRQGFARMCAMGAARKAVIFTECRHPGADARDRKAAARALRRRHP